MSVFVLKVEKTFDLSCLPEDDENVFETRETRSFYPEDDLISRKRLVFDIFLTF